MIYRRKDGWWSSDVHLLEVDSTRPDKSEKPMRAVIEKSLSLCRGRKLCVQAGGFIGVWPATLAKHFDKVITFEVVPELLECIHKNLEGIKNVEVFTYALGHMMGQEPLLVRVGGRTLVGRVEADKVHSSGVVTQVTLDSLELPALDALFLDIEGWEVQALLGARETIAKYSPVIQAELLKETREPIIALLADYGYRLVTEVSKCDGVFTK